MTLLEGSDTFKNELGNEITVSVEDTLENDEPRVRVLVVGPNSESENIITRIEAEKLFLALKGYLKC